MQAPNDNKKKLPPTEQPTMPPSDPLSKAEQQFWEQLASVGKEVLAQGKLMGFGMSLVEIKFMNSQPSVVIRSISQNLLFPSDAEAQIGIARELEASKQAEFNGARTLTVVYTQGSITKLIVDEYSTKLLNSKQKRPA